MASRTNIKKLIQAGVLKARTSTGKVFYKDKDTLKWKPVIEYELEKSHRVYRNIHEWPPIGLLGKMSWYNRAKREVQITLPIKIVVWIQDMGLYPPGYVICHRDGNAYNNKRENLILIPDKSFDYYLKTVYYEMHKDPFCFEFHGSKYALPVYTQPPSNYLELFDKYQKTQKEWQSETWIDLEPETKYKVSSIRKSYQYVEDIELDF